MAINNCPRCNRPHTGVCGIPPQNRPRFQTGFSTRELQPSVSAFRPGIINNHDQQAARRTALTAINTRINRLETVLTALLPEAVHDPAMAAEVILIRQTIQRLKEPV